MTQNRDLHPRGFTAGPGLFLSVICLVSVLAITARSFWIDEVYSARLAQQPTPQDCWRLLTSIKGSDPQMPLYVVWIWACEKLVGSGELALRAVNLLWFVPALWVLVRALAGNRGLQWAVFLAAALNPFAWYYLNEARAYAMQFSTSLVLFAALCHWSQKERSPAASERRWVFGFALAFFLLCGSSLLSVLLAGTPLLLALLLLPPQRRSEVVGKSRLVWTSLLLALLALGLYYLWTLRSGDRATALATTGWKNLLFIGYELLGCDGLGPGRLEIRSNGLAVFKPYAAGLAVYVGLTGSLLALAIADLRRQFGVKKLLGFLLAGMLPAGLILVASVVLHFRVLGRHLAALLPVAILLIGLGLHAAWRRGPWGRALAVAFLVMYFGSALSLRFAARHEKDNYRSAAALAKTALAAGKTVWWNADVNAAIYYQLPLATKGAVEKGKALWVIHAWPGMLSGAEPPELILTSRPDVFDENGVLAEFLARTHYQRISNLPGFTGWERPR